MAQVGDHAPDFSLPAYLPDRPSIEARISLNEVLQQRKVVLAFYAEDGTPTWIRELSSLREEYATIRELGAEVLAISADSLESHSRFAEREGGFPFPLLSDPQLEVIRAYQVMDEQGRRARRALFVVGRDGGIECAVPHYNPANSAQFLEVFEALGLSLE